MKSRVAECTILLSFLVVGCQRTSNPQGGDVTPPDNVSTVDSKLAKPDDRQQVEKPTLQVDSKPAKPADKQQVEKPTIQNDKKTVLSAEDEVVDFLATREMLTQVFIDSTSPIRQTRLQFHFIDWLALGVNEPLDQRLALAQASYFGHRMLKDKNYFDGGYRDSVKSSLAVGIIMCEITTKLLRENKDYAKNYLTIAERDLASEVRRELILSADDAIGKGFDSDLAGYTTRTLAFMTNDAPPKMAKVHAALRQAIHEALPKHRDLTESLKGKIKITAEVRASHERVSKLIRAASGG